MHRQRSAQWQNSLPKVKEEARVRERGQLYREREGEKKKELHVRLSSCFWK